MGARRRRAFGVALWLTAFALAFSGCKKNEERMAVRLLLVDVDPRAKSADGPLEREHLRALAQSVLSNDPRIWLREGAKEGATLRIRISPALGATELTAPLTAPSMLNGTGLVLDMEATSDPGQPGGELLRVAGQSISDTAGAVGADTVVQQMMREALDQLMLTRRARDLDDTMLISWLKPGATVTEGQRRQAMRILAARKSPAAIPVFIDLLSSEDRLMAVNAFGALTSMVPPDDQKAAVAAAIIDFSEAKATLVRKQAIAALSRIDTPLGRAWLWTMSSGHPDDDVQQRAKEALAGLDASIFIDDADAKMAEQQTAAEDTRVR